MFFYDWLQRPRSIPESPPSNDDFNKNTISRKNSTKSAAAAVADNNHSAQQNNDISMMAQLLMKEASKQQQQIIVHDVNQNNNNNNNDDKDVDEDIVHVVDAFPLNSSHVAADNSNNDETATLTEDDDDTSDISSQFLRAWEEHEKRMAQHEQNKIHNNTCSCKDDDDNEEDSDAYVDDDDDDVEPLRKIPFFSLDLRLDETEHSEDEEDDEDVTASSSLLEQEVKCFVLHTGAYPFAPDCTAKQQQQQQDQAELSLPLEEEEEEDAEDERIPFFSLDLRLGLDETERSEEEEDNTDNDDNFLLHTGASPIVLEPLWNMNSNNNNALTLPTAADVVLLSSCQDYDDDDDDDNDDESVDLEDILLDRDSAGHLLFRPELSSSPILDAVLSSSTRTRISACTSSPAVQELIARVSSSPPSPSSSSSSLPPLISHHDDTERATTNEDYQKQQPPQHYQSALLLPPSPLSPVSRKSWSHEPELSGPAPPITHRTPIPTWISFSLVCTDNNNNNTGTTDSSSFFLSSIQDGNEEDEKVDNIEDDDKDDMQQQQAKSSPAPLNNEILDPTDPLICGKITTSDYLQAVSIQMELFLLAASGDDIDTLCQTTISWMAQHPMVCQVKYRPPEFYGHCYPLSYFAAAGWLEGCQAAYNAFPEAIGQDDNSTGLPLHYACLHQAGYNVISFLVEKHPEATRITNNHQHETPLHLYCRSIFGGDDVKRNHDDDEKDGDYRSSADESGQLKVIELLLRHYPTAAQLADLDGFTPLHLVCQRRNVRLPVLKALQASSPTVIRAATRSWHKPAHIAALHGASYPVMEWLLQTDPTVSPTTVEDFSTVLHCAVQGQCSASVIRMIRDAHPKALTWTNSSDETPYRVGERMGVSSEILQLLTVPDDNNNDSSSNYSIDYL